MATNAVIVTRTLAARESKICTYSQMLLRAKVVGNSGGHSEMPANSDASCSHLKEEDLKTYRGRELMATNPQVPFERDTAVSEKRPQLVRGNGAPKRPSSGVPGVLLSIILAAALLAVIRYYMPRAPKKTPPPTAAELPQQPGGNQLQFSNLQMAPAPTGGAVTLRGLVMNTGGRPVIGAHVALRFRDSQGRILQTLAAPMIGMAAKKNNLETDEFSRDPLKPNDTRPFQVTASQVPARMEPHDAGNESSHSVS